MKGVNHEFSFLLIISWWLRLVLFVVEDFWFFCGVTHLFLLLLRVESINFILIVVLFNSLVLIEF